MGNCISIQLSLDSIPPLLPRGPRPPRLPRGPRPRPPQGIRLRPSTVYPDQDIIEETEECPSRTQDDWVISMKDELGQLHRRDDITIWSKLCIYRIPKHLHETHNKSYSPQTVSIGPHYNGEKHLQSMESHKWRAVNKVLVRSNQRLEVYIDAMRELEEKARACYEGVISMSSNEFLRMLVLDGCFLLETLMGALYGFVERGYARNDPVFAMRESMHLIQRDMMMLENQLPFFVLTRLLELELKPHTRELPNNFVANLAIEFFKPLIPGNRYINEVNKDEEAIHFLDVFHRSLVLPKLYNQNSSYIGLSVVDKSPQYMIDCVMKLRVVSINFKKRVNQHFWDIKFENGCLEIPKLCIHEGTKSLFLNLIAFEQCHIGYSNDITSYIIFMDNLIDSAEDVGYLKECGIIEHWLESDSEVADLFNQIGRQGIVFDIEESYLYKEVSCKVWKYYHRRNKYFRKWYTCMTTLKEKHLNSPWAFISVCAASILLVLTFLQCYYAAYDHYNPSSSGDKKG